MSKSIKERLEYLRGELQAERISTGELVELQSLAKHIAADDVELLAAAGVPEFPEPIEYSSGPWSAKDTMSGQSLVSSDATGKTIAVVYDNTNGDAQLIAASPELLASLQLCAKRYADILDNCLFPPYGDKSRLTPDQIAWREQIKTWLKETRAVIANTIGE